MPLSPSTHLGPYEIVAPLGAGGIGEVYRARDTRLGRDVAIKVPPAGFARDSERVSAVEPRIRTVILYVGGLAQQRALPEVEPIHFLPRITVPVLMLNGRFDHYFPVETSQRPFFRLLGTPPANKRQVIADGGHFVPRNQLIGESLDWLDRHLGPVR